jgi:hypothetical protein
MALGMFRPKVSKETGICGMHIPGSCGRQSSPGACRHPEEQRHGQGCGPVLYQKSFLSPASPLYLFESHRYPALPISIPAESPAGECVFAQSQLHTSVIVILHSLNMRMHQAGASRMLHCLAADACGIICEVSAAVQGIKTFKSLPEKHRSHSKNPARSARFLVTARRLR